MAPVFVLGSHVRHVGAGVRVAAPSGKHLRWFPLCRQRSGVPFWKFAATPAQNARPVCTHCIREARRIAGAVL